MSHRDWIAFWLIGMVAAGTWAAYSFLSPTAKLHRRRRKSHSHIKAKTNRPMVRFSVKPPKE
jgi:hypothetical protein